MPSKRKKMRQEKGKTRGGEKEKSKSQDSRTLQANALHLDQKAANCTTCKRFLW